MEDEVEGLTPEERAALEQYAAGWDAAAEVAHWKVTAARTIPIAAVSIIAIIIALVVR